ncbi:hypothetical protein GCM10027262_61490 [Nocardia tengchongensis]
MLIPVRQHSRVESFAGEYDQSQRKLTVRLTRIFVPKVRGTELLERKRCLVEDGHLLACRHAHDIVWRPGGGGVHDYQAATTGQRAEDLPHRVVEREGVEQHPHVAGLHADLGARVHQVRRHGAMGNGHALGPTGRPRGVDDVGDVVGAQRAGPVGVGDRCRSLVAGDLVEQHHVARVSGHKLAHVAGRDYGDRIGVVQHVFQPIGRMRDIQRQVSGA